MRIPGAGNLGGGTVIMNNRIFVSHTYADIAVTVRTRLLSFVNRLNLHSALAGAGMMAPLMLAIGDLTAGLSTPGYSIIHHSISSLALTRIGWLQTIGFLALGLLVEIFTAGLLFNIKRFRGFPAGIGLLVIFGFALLLIGAFRTDPVGAARTIEGRIHGFTASTAFSLFPVALLFLIPSLRNDPNWKGLLRYTAVTFIMAVVFVVVLRIMQEQNSWFGLTERLLVLNMMVWVEVAAIRLFILSLRRKVKA
jgi:hypothetical protein